MPLAVIQAEVKQEKAAPAPGAVAVSASVKQAVQDDLEDDEPDDTESAKSG